MLIVAGLLVLAIACFLFYYNTQMTWVESPPYQRASEAPTRTLVVVYSRTGNTMAAAKEAARHFDADLLKIEAPQYARNIKGLQLASRHADQHLTSTPILHEPVDPSRYDMIFLCSPIWWFRPAVPLWSFVENHNFAGKPVFLLLTGNSRYKQELIDQFSELVQQQSGKYLGKLFVRRGRIYWQKTPEEVNQEVLDALKLHKELWPASAYTP